MGGLIPVVAIIIIIVIVVRKFRKKTALEKLKNSAAYALALKIKEELEKKGGYFGEHTFDDYDLSLNYKTLSCSIDSVIVNIGFSSDPFSLGLWETLEKNWAIENDKCLMGIKNYNIPVSVTVISSPREKDFQKNMKEVIRIVAEVIENNGYGICIDI